MQVLDLDDATQLRKRNFQQHHQLKRTLGCVQRNEDEQRCNYKFKVESCEAIAFQRRFHNTKIEREEDMKNRGGLTSPSTKMIKCCDLGV